MASKSARRWYIALIVVLALYGTYRYTLHRMVKAKLDEIRRQGYPVTLAELDKWYPQPPPGENAADIYLQAFAKSDVNKWRRLTLMKPNWGYVAWPVRGEHLSNEVRAAVQQCLNENKDALALLHKASALQSARYPIDLAQGAESTLPHLEKLCFGAQLLALESIIAIERGDKPSALKSITDCLATSLSLVNEPILVSQSVRRFISRTAVKTLEQIINTTALDAPQLASLSPQFLDEEIPYGTPRAIIAQRCIAIDMFDRIRTGRLPKEEFEALLSGDLCGQPTIPKVLFPLYKAGGFLDFDLLKSLEFFDWYVHLSVMPLPGRRIAARSVHQPDEDCLRNWWYHFTSAFIPGLFPFIQKEADFGAQLRVARVALAVERFRAANTKLPDQLGELFPAFLEKLPDDPFDGQPLRYKKLTKGYVVYSVGEDGKDDGGDEKKDITFTVER
jgi:hypothetical protein